MSVELALLGQILRLANDPEVCVSDLVDVVERVPSLAAKVIRVANSAYYGMEGSIGRLDKATLVLGCRAVSEIAGSLIVASRMSSFEIGALRGEALWLHSLSVGIGARLLSARLELDVETESYLAGLLHDLGMVDMAQAHGERYAQVVTETARAVQPLEPRERAAFDRTHADCILERAAEWGLPPEIRSAIGHHHDPLQAPASQRGPAALVRAAHALVSPEAGGWSDAPGGPEAAELLRDLGVMRDDEPAIRAELEARLKQALATLGAA